MKEEVEAGRAHHKHSSLEQCHKQRSSMVRVTKSSYLNTPQVLDVGRSKVHPLVRNLFHVKVRQAPLAGRLKFYSENWGKLTQDVNILSIIQGFKIPFSQTPFQFGPPQLARVNQEERSQINSKIKEMLRKRGILLVKSEPGEFLSNLFWVNKKAGHRPVINKCQISEQLHAILTSMYLRSLFTVWSVIYMVWNLRCGLFSKFRVLGILMFFQCFLKAFFKLTWRA